MMVLKAILMFVGFSVLVGCHTDPPIPPREVTDLGLDGPDLDNSEADSGDTGITEDMGIGLDMQGEDMGAEPIDRIRPASSASPTAGAVRANSSRYQGTFRVNAIRWEQRASSENFKARLAPMK